MLAEMNRNVFIWEWWLVLLVRSSKLVCADQTIQKDLFYF